MSAELGRSVLASLKSCGVRDILICPGARNAVFVDALTDNPDFNVIWHFEERSAGFFAVGRSAATDRPVAVITTSGTAAGELLPAMMEAYYSGVPLIAVTADRPRHFRGSGAPQAAEQLGIYGIYAPLSLDISSDESIQLPANLNRPVHINVCLNDPRGTTAQESPIPEESLTSFLSRVQRPLVIVGQLEPHLRADTRSFLGALGAPSYFEALSGLRGVPELDQIAIKLADGIFGRHDFDGVLRLGRVPTHRLWRDLEDSRSNLPVFSISALPFTGLGRSSGLAASIEIDSPTLPNFSRREVIADDHSRYQALTDLLDQYPTSEPGLIRQLSLQIDGRASFYLGNSLPIREWDLAGVWNPDHDFRASRGLNGIDGQLSTFLGGCQSERPNWAILGDLTALYDLAGLWPAAAIDPHTAATVVVINNSGGKIFERMFPNDHFQNRHAISFESWAKMWSVDYQCVDDVRAIHATQPGIRVIEVRPDPTATQHFWAAHRERLQ